MRSFSINHPWLRSLSATFVLALVATTAIAYEPTSRYVIKDIEGWQVYVHRDLLLGGKQHEVGEPALRQLKYGLAKTRQMVADGPLAKLRKVKIWLEIDSTNGKHGRTSGYQYHPALPWLVKMDFNPGKVKCVEFGNAAGLAKRSDFKTVQVTMHELAHAYHHQVYGWDDPDVLAAHKRAREDGKYPPNDWVVRANHKEFFAGLSTRYFESEERRKEIVDRDPVFAKKLEEFWGKPKALFDTPLGDSNVSDHPDAVRGNTVMWYRQPAESWPASLPLGNGRLGALVWGKVGDEIIHLNEDTFWAGGPYTHCNEEGVKHIEEVRRLVFAKKYREAHELFDKTMLGKPVEQLKYLPLCDLQLSFPFRPHIDDYRRELDLDTGIAKVQYKANGVKYTREVFVSAADQVIVVHLAADKPGAIDGVGIWLQGRTNSRENSGETFVVENARDGMVLKGRNCDDRGVPGQVTYEVRMKVIRKGGSMGGEGWGADPRLRVRGADSVTMVISAATSFANYKDVSGDPAIKAEKHLAAAAQKSYEQLRTDSIAEHQRLFRRVEVSMTPTNDAARPTDVRLKNFDVADDPQLAALVYQFGRYLLMCSSRPGTQPANLQGIWNPRMTPSWESKYTTNINVEMNYWPAEVGNLAECVGPLEDLIRDISEGPGALVARKQYDAGGWVLHQNTDIWRASAPMDGASWGTWTLGGAWICTHFWEHYLFNPDEEYLRRVYPILKGCCQFFLDTLVEHPERKWLVTCPSSSPENGPKGREDKSPKGEDGRVRGTTIAAGPTMDMQILRYMFASTAKAAEILDVDPEFRKQLGKTRGRLAPNQVGQHGQLQEWLGDWDSPTDRHRHFSHLWGMYPGNEISMRRTPDLARAVAKSLEFRGEGGTGFGMTWQMCLWARMYDSEKAFRMFTNNVMRNTYLNLFGKCFGAPQVDGTFGAAAGIAEMLLQSQDSDILVLPALPRQWPGGSVKGMRARGGFELDFAWEDGRLTALTVHSKCGKPCKIRYGDRGDTAVIELKETKAGESYKFDERFRFSMVDDVKRGRLHVKEADKKILTYNYGMQLNTGVDEKYERACYIHPLWDVSGWQRTLTEDFPALDEHYHHRGLGWMWPDVRVRDMKVSTWEPSRPPLRQHFVKWLKREADHNRATLAVENAWLLDDKEKVLTETVEIVMHPLQTVTTVTDEKQAHNNRPFEVNARAIDLTLTFEAVGGPLDLRGGYYGGLMLRGSSDMQYEGVITTDLGVLDGDRSGNYMWADLTSRTEQAHKHRGVAIFIHPDHPPLVKNERRSNQQLYPPRWLARTSFAGLLNPFWPGSTALRLVPGKPVTLQYRLYVHEGDAEIGQVAMAYAEYIKKL